MSVLLNAAVIHAGKVVVDDMLDVADINAASSDTSGHQDGTLSGAEGTHGSLALQLGTVSVHRRAGEAHVVEEVVNLIGGALRVDEDNGTAGGNALERRDQLGTLDLGRDQFNTLEDVAVGASNAADIDLRMANVQVLASHLAQFEGERGREEHVLDVAGLLVYNELLVGEETSEERRRPQHTGVEHDGLEVLRPVVLEHLIGFVEDEVAKTAHGEDVGAVDEVLKTTGGGDEDVAALAKLLDLIAHGTTTVGNAGAKHGAVAELASLAEDLDRKFTGRAHDDDERLGADGLRDALNELSGVRTRSRELLGLAHQLAEDGDQVGGGLARA